jgi:hypothetical protein
MEESGLIILMGESPLIESVASADAMKLGLQSGYPL